MVFAENTLASEVDRVLKLPLRLHLPVHFGLNIQDEFLCEVYLRHFIDGNQSIPANTPIIHLNREHILPLISPCDWSAELLTVFMNNQAIYGICNKSFKVSTLNWAASDPPMIGPLFSDQTIEFYTKRYYRVLPGRSEHSGYMLDVFKARSVKKSGKKYCLKFRLLKIHDPSCFHRNFVAPVYDTLTLPTCSVGIS